MFWKSYRWVFIWSLFIFIVCIIPSNRFPSTSFIVIKHIDKYVHVLMFLVLNILSINAIKKATALAVLNNKILFISFSYSMVYGLFIEFIQHLFIKGRNADLYDILADLIGVIIGMIFVKYLYKLKVD